MSKLALTLVAALALTAGCSSAVSTVGFPAADANDDDMLNRAEFEEFWDDTDAWERFDDNDDNMLSRTEYNEAVDANYEPDGYFRGLDTNNSGNLSRDELVGGWFNMFDMNKNGMLDDDEFDNAIESLNFEI